MVDALPGHCAGEGGGGLCVGFRVEGRGFRVWGLLGFLVVYWGLLGFIGVYWGLLGFIGVYWGLLVFIGFRV